MEFASKIARLASPQSGILLTMSATIAEVYSSMGLTSEEYALILRLVGREPTLTELGMFAVMWSEHCGYKYSRPVLAYFKKYKEAMEGSGLENAGLVDLGGGLAVTMKVESHNHPSAVEPYQGAATGVGGIIRDILTMGARPIAGLNSLRFGPIEYGQADDAVVDNNRYLMEHVVAGIAGYGNCVGVPTVAGEVNFHPRYSGNPLVNAMCVGIVETDKVTTAAASGFGNPVIYLGTATGRDGIHGATFASEALDEESDAKRPNVQIGDPFAEKSLIEATLEALDTGAIVAIQDMGAAGLTCSTVEMASKGKVGMTVDLDLVPMRENDMSAYELMLSESQERMLAVAQKGRENEVISVFKKWGLHAVVIGEVTDTGRVTVTRHGEIHADVDPTLLTDHCPTYSTPAEIPSYHRKAGQFDPETLPNIDAEDALLKLLASPDIADKKWVFRQYDQQVQTQTTLKSGAGDAAVLSPRGTEKGLAVKIDGNARATYFDPYVGGQLAVIEAARNVACVGAKPVAVTDGLNFGNPQKPHVFWQFSESVRGIADAAEFLGTPVISGNVSFYNESDLGEVLPTPLIGMLGFLEYADHRVGIAPNEEDGDLLLIEVPLKGIRQAGLGASAFASVLGIEDGLPVKPNLEGETALITFLIQQVEQRALLSAHDASEGGVAVALAEIAIRGDLGIEADLGESELGSTSKLFGEFPGQVVVATSPEESDSVLAAAAALGLSASFLGRFSRNGSELAISVQGEERIRLGLEQLKEAYCGTIPDAMRH